MTEEKVENQQKRRNEDVDYAYAVIDAVVESMDKVAANPVLARQFMGELLQKMPQVIDSLMAITVEEHRPVMKKLISGSSRMMGACLKVAQK